MDKKNAPQEDSILIRLSVVQPGNIDHPERRILLTESNPTVQLGRSSSRPSLGLQPAVTNGWYNSPVMSRHHAELEANFANEASTLPITVGIRDLGSMHGTYLNKDKIDGHMPQPTRLRVGDELTLGMPVFRNREEFQPALVRVDGVEFCEASRRPTTTPTRTFTVPDDCSTDDNEPLDESFDEPMALATGMNVTVGLVENETTVPVGAPDSQAGSFQPQAENHFLPCHPHVGSSQQLDGAVDDISTPSDVPPHSAYLRAREGQSSRSGVPSRDVSLVFNGRYSAGLSGLTVDLTGDLDTDEEDQDEDEGEGLDLDSLCDIDTDIDIDTPNATHGDRSRSVSWNNLSSDSEDEHMDDESALDESTSDGLAIFEEDSDDEFGGEADVDGTGEPDADIDSEQQHVHGLRAPTAEIGIGCARNLVTPFQRLPPISSVIAAGPNDWIPCSSSNRAPRSPSPSDAVLLHSYRRAEAASGEQTQGSVCPATPKRGVMEKEEVAVDRAPVSAENSLPAGVSSFASGNGVCSLNVVAEVAPPEAIAIDDYDVTMQGDLSGVHADVDDSTALIQKSGKAEFFAAREINKKILHDNERIESAFEVVAPKQCDLDISYNDEREVEFSVAPMKEPEAAVRSSGFILAAHAHGLTGDGRGVVTVDHPEPANTQRQSPFDSEPSHNRKAALWATWDPDSYEPSSAHELQCLKQQISVEPNLLPWPPRNVTISAQSEYKELAKGGATHVDVLASNGKELEVSAALSQSFKQLQQQSQDLDKQATSVLRTEKHDAKNNKRKASEISEETSQEVDWASSVSLGNESKAASLPEAARLSSRSAARSKREQLPLPSPPPSPEERVSPEQRPTKRIKKIAERVGYAALGGVSVGAMVLTSLIYTAPSFV